MYSHTFVCSVAREDVGFPHPPRWCQPDAVKIRICFSRSHNTCLSFSLLSPLREPCDTNNLTTSSNPIQCNAIVTYLKGHGYSQATANIGNRRKPTKWILSGRWLERAEPNLIHFIWGRRANSHLVFGTVRWHGHFLERLQCPKTDTLQTLCCAGSRLKQNREICLEASVDIDVEVRPNIRATWFQLK